MKIEIADIENGRIIEVSFAWGKWTVKCPGFETELEPGSYDFRPIPRINLRRIK